MSRSRQITVFVLIFLTLFLAGVMIYIGVRVTQEDTAPDDSSAATIQCGRIQCTDGREAGHDCSASFSSCEARAAEFCGGAENVQQANIDVAALCGTSQPTPTDSSLQCSNGANEGTGCLIFICPNGCGSDGKCEGSDAGVQVFTESGSCNATLDGRCGQIDIVVDPRVDSPNPGFQCVKEITCGTPVCNPQPTCGDGTVNQSSEECDDGNTQNGDGCSSTCKLEESDPGTFTVTSLCTENNVSIARLNWSPGDAQGTGTTRIRVDSDSGFAQGDGFWTRLMNQGAKTALIPNQFAGTSGITGDMPGLIAGQTYYVRINDVETNQYYTLNGEITASFVAEDCDTQTPAPGCGDPCTTNDECPDDHVCSQGTCQLEACIGNASCTQNGCVLPLPATAIIDDRYDKLLFGGLFIIMGMLMVKYNVFAGALNLKDFIESTNKINSKPKSSLNKRIRKTRKKFEDKF